jgi:ABC-type antimicrobial peptide transport system permease subunit
VSSEASVLISGLRPVFIGAVLGLAGAAGGSALLHSTLAFPGTPDLFYGVSAFDPVTFLGLACFLAAVAALAAAIPTWRGTKVDPMVALRYE